MNKLFIKKYWYILIEFVVIIATLIALDQGITQSVQIAFVVTIILALFLPHRDVLVLATLLLPLSNIIKFSIDSYTVLPFIICIYIVKSLVAKPRISRRFIFLYIPLLLISLSVSIIKYNSFSYPLPFFVYLLFAYLAIRDNYGKKIFNRAAIVYILSAILVILGSHLFVEAAWMIGSYSDYMVRSVGFSTPWSFGGTMLLASAFTAVLYKKRIINPITMVSLVSFFIYFGIQSGTFSIFLGLLLVMYFIISNITKNKRLKALILTSFPLVLYFGYIFVLKPMMALRSGISDNSRVDIWISYLQIFMNNFDIMLFGVGGGCIPNYANEVGILTAHNFIIELIVQFGVIGVALLLAIIVGLFRNSINKLSKNENALPLYVFLLYLLTQGGAGSETLFILLILSYVNKINLDISKENCYKDKCDSSDLNIAFNCSG